MTQSQSASSCEKFARYVEKVASETQSTDEFMDRLGTEVAGFPNGTPTPNPVKSQVGFGESGYNKEFIDGDGHPDRHFTANAVLAYHTSGVVSSFVAKAREIPGLGCKGAACSRQDVKLGRQGATAGEQLRTGKMDRSQFGNWIRKHL